MSLVCLHLCFHLCFHLSLFVSLCLSLCLCVSVCLCVSLCLYVCLFDSMCVSFICLAGGRFHKEIWCWTPKTDSNKKTQPSSCNKTKVAMIDGTSNCSNSWCLGWAKVAHKMKGNILSAHQRYLPTATALDSTLVEIVAETAHKHRAGLNNSRMN